MTQEDPRILELRRVRAKALEGGGEERIKKQKAKGKLTARERVKLLLDKGTFNEIEPFITHQGDEMNLLKEKYYGDGVITGYGQINGRTVYISIHSISPSTAARSARCSRTRSAASWTWLYATVYRSSH